MLALGVALAEPSQGEADTQDGGSSYREALGVALGDSERELGASSPPSISREGVPFSSVEGVPFSSIEGVPSSSGLGGASGGGSVDELVRLIAHVRSSTEAPSTGGDPTTGGQPPSLSYESLSVYRRGASLFSSGLAPPSPGPSVQAKQERGSRYVVRPVSGSLPPASLCALMGPSGSGTFMFWGGNP